MDTDIKPTLNSGSDTVHELISQLRSSFSSIELEKLISQRQQNMDQKLNELETKIEEVVKEKSLLFSENTKQQKKIEALTAANLAYKDQVKIFSPDKIRVLEKELKFKEKELKAKENEIRVLKKKNEDCEKKVKVYKKRFSDLDERVLLLEETAKEELKRFSIDFENIKQEKIWSSESSRPPLSSEKRDSNKKTEPKFEDIIKLDDDDDDDDDDRCIRSEKRKWVSDSSDDNEFMSVLTTKRVSKETERGDGDKISVETQKKKKPMTCHPVSTPPSVGIGPKNLLSYFNIIDSRSCQDIGKISEGNKSVTAKLKKRWECEEDMLKEFEKDDELCLDAICALHRQRIRVNVYDVSRVANLAKLLIDGDPEKKLKKRASELKQFDLEHCRMFAKEYSPKLFKIYQQKDDPFFPSASSK